MCIVLIICYGTFLNHSDNPLLWNIFPAANPASAASNHHAQSVSNAVVKIWYMPTHTKPNTNKRAITLYIVYSFLFLLLCLILFTFQCYSIL